MNKFTILVDTDAYTKEALWKSLEILFKDRRIRVVDIFESSTSGKDVKP